MIRQSISKTPSHTSGKNSRKAEQRLLTFWLLAAILAVSAAAVITAIFTGQLVL